MNKRQKLVQQQYINNEEAVIKRLKTVYNQSLQDVTKKSQKLYDDIKALTDELDSIEDEEEREIQKSKIRSKVYQKKYQDGLKKQISDILDDMQKENFQNVSDYLNTCYEEGFVGALYDLQGQGLPLAFPIDQEAMVRAVQTDSKISQGLYSRLGEDTSLLKRKITSEVTRGIATGMSFKQVAQQLSGQTNIGFNNAVRIARTEGHRIQVQSAMDACYKAKEKGADVVKQWDSTLDAKTRESHTMVDGEVKELDEKFSNGLMFPGDPSGGAAEVVNCRCALLQRARWALEDGFTKMNNFTKQLESFEKPEDYAEFKKAFFSKENRNYMNYVQQMEDKYETKDFRKVLDKMDDREYKHYSQLLSQNPIYNKNNHLKESEGNELNQTIKITKKNHASDYGVVDRNFVNSKKFHDKYEDLTPHKKVNESLYQESMKILEHRDGTAFEDFVAVDSLTGKIVESVIDHDEIGKVKITNKQYEKIVNHKGNIILLHNHPNGSRPSYADIIKLKEPNITSVVSVGHDGSVYKIYDLDSEFDIDIFYKKMYNSFAEIYKEKILAERYATDALYKIGKFKMESR